MAHSDYQSAVLEQLGIPQWQLKANPNANHSSQEPVETESTDVVFSSELIHGLDQSLVDDLMLSLEQDNLGFTLLEGDSQPIQCRLFVGQKGTQVTCDTHMDDDVSHIAQFKKMLWQHLSALK